MALPQTDAQMEAMIEAWARSTPADFSRMFLDAAMFGVGMVRKSFRREPITDDMMQMCDDLGIESGLMVEPISYRSVVIPIPRRHAPDVEYQAYNLRDIRVDHGN